MEAPNLIAVVIGDPTHLKLDDAIRMAKRLTILIDQAPTAVVMPAITGYDDDPRELYEFPEVCLFVTQFCAACDALGSPISTWVMTNDTRAWIGGCLWPQARIADRTFNLSAKMANYLGYDLSITDQFKPYKGVAEDDDRTC